MLVADLKYPDAKAYWIQLIWNVIYVVTPLLALLVMEVVMDRIERKTLILITSVITAAPLVVFGVSTNDSAVIVSGGIAGVLTGLVVTVFFAYIPEAIPTEARGLGSGIINGMGQAGGAVAGFLGAAIHGGWGRGALMAAAAAAYILFAVAVLFGPRATNRSLEGVAAEELSTA